MATITIEVPEELSEQLAQIGDLLPELLRLSLQQQVLPAHIYRYILDFLASKPTPEQIAAFTPTLKMQERLQTLLERSKAGQLTPTEQRELDEYERSEHLVSMLKAGNLPDQTVREDQSPPANTKETSLTLSLSQEHKQTLEKAAAMRCLTLSEYLLELALNAATQEIAAPEQIVLSNRDWDLFVSVLENPPEPNETLKAAIKEHQEKYGKW